MISGLRSKDSYIFRCLSFVFVSTCFDKMFNMYVTAIYLQNILFKFLLQVKSELYLFPRDIGQLQIFQNAFSPVI